jgi:hypothetical protein
MPAVTRMEAQRLQAQRQHDWRHAALLLFEVKRYYMRSLLLLFKGSASFSLTFL